MTKETMISKLMDCFFSHGLLQFKISLKQVRLKVVTSKKNKAR